MKKTPLVAVAFAIACVLVVASFSNVVGVRIAASSNHLAAQDEVDQKELLFQTIIDIANNKEIQKTLLDSKINSPHVFTMKELNNAYRIGLMLMQIASVSKIHQLLEHYQLITPEIQKKISTLIERNDALNKEVKQLSILNCHCNNVNSLSWNFPVLCMFLLPLICALWPLVFWPWLLFDYEPQILHFLLIILTIIGLTLNCFWV